MSNYNLKLENVTKTFGRRLIFKNLNFSLVSGNVYGIAGPNGSGKSTLAKILCGLITATSGKVIHQLDGKTLASEVLHNHIGFLSPYLFLYDEFSAEENLIYFARIRGHKYDNEKVDSLLTRFNLYNRRNDLMKEYSSGMKQRIKFLFSLLHSPELLILDEPTSNLDNEGKDKFYEIIKEQGKSNLVIIASNEESDLALCDEVIRLEQFKNEKS
ncbi:ATP-binding cassette domain-containing protein [Bacteroidota bacterium]